MNPVDQSSGPFPHAQQFFSGSFFQNDSDRFPVFGNTIFPSLQIGETPADICSHVKKFVCSEVVQSGVSLHVETSPESPPASHPHLAKLVQSSEPASAAVLKYTESVVDKKKQPFGPQDNSLICRAEVLRHANVITALAQANAVWIGFLHLPLVNSKGGYDSSKWRCCSNLWLAFARGSSKRMA